MINKYVKSIKNKAFEFMVNKYGNRYIQYRKEWESSQLYKFGEFPLDIALDLKDACNMQCPQCVRSMKSLLSPNFSSSGKELNFRMIKKILDEAKKYHLPSLTINGGGEPLLYKNIEQLINYAVKCEMMDIRLITNGILLTGDKFKSLVDARLPILSVSLDAFTQETYHRVRGGNLAIPVNNVLKAIELKKDILIRVSFVTQEGNKHEVNDFINFWKDKADIIDIQAYINYRKESVNPNFECFEPWRRITIWHDGRITPCCGFMGYNLSLGNINNSTIYDAWNGSALKEIRKNITNNRYCLMCIGKREEISYE